VADLTLSDGVTSVTLPDLVWTDRDDWGAVVQATEYTLSGAIVIEEAERLSGRPITLLGGLFLAWMTRTALDSLLALGADPGVELTLTLIDAGTYAVTPRRDGPGGAWVEARQVPRVHDGGVADPGATTKYVIERVRLMEIPA